MDERMTLFLSIMDTVHDFSSKSRTEKSLNKKMLQDDIDDDLKTSLGSTAFLIDFLMLGLFHDKFRQVIGLDVNKNYIKNAGNCDHIRLKNSADINVFKSTPITKQICSNFYLPTYAERIIFRSEEPEELAFDIILQYLNQKNGYNTSIIERSYDSEDSLSLPNNRIVRYNIGNKGVEESVDDKKEYAPEIENIVNELLQTKKTIKNIQNNSQVLERLPSKFKYLQGQRKGQLRDEYKAHFCLKHKPIDDFKEKNQLTTLKGKLQQTINKKDKDIIQKEINKIENILKDKSKIGVALTKSKTPSGIYLTDRDQKKYLYNIVNSHFKPSEETKLNIIYVSDENQLNNEWFSYADQTHYKGRFVDFDAGSTKGADNNNVITTEGKPTKFKRRIAAKREFQQYSLLKSKNELFYFHELGCFDDDGAFTIGYKTSSTEEFREVYLNIPKGSNNSKKAESDLRGVPLFLIFINEVNKRTMSYKSIQTIPLKEKKEFIDTTKNFALKVIEHTYRFTIKFTDKNRDIFDVDGKKLNIPQLLPYDFVMALFDLKRSMDYLFVKACATANANSTPDKKYVFVSNDRLAILYSLLHGNPSILTPPVATEENEDCEMGDHFIVMFPEGAKPNSTNAKPNSTNAKPNSPNVKPNSTNVKPNSTNAKPNSSNVKPNNSNTKIDNVLFYDAEDDDNNVETYKSPFQPIIDHLRQSFTKLDQQIEEVKDKSDIKKICADFVASYKEVEKSTDNKIVIPKKLRKAISSDYVPKTGRDPKYNIKDEKVQQAFTMCDALLKMPSTSKSGGSESYKYKKMLDTQIPLDGLEGMCEVGSPMFIFFDYYRRLTPSISFLWYIVFKSLLYFSCGDDMHLESCERFNECSQTNNNTADVFAHCPILLRSISSPASLNTSRQSSSRQSQTSTSF